MTTGRVNQKGGDGLGSSSEVVHDDTQGGESDNPHEESTQTGHDHTEFNETPVAAVADAVVGPNQLSTDNPNDKINLSAIGAANGVAPLNSQSVIPNANIPDLAVTEVWTVTLETDLVTLTDAQQGDIGIVTDPNPFETYILVDTDPTVQSNWNQIAVESSPVTSVNGETGDVMLDAAAVGALPDTYSAPVTSVNGSTGDVNIGIPVESVNGETGAVSLNAADVGALPDTYSAPVTSVNGKVGEVTIDTSGGGGAVEVASYSDLPDSVSNRQLYYVTGAEDYVRPISLDPASWISMLDGDLVVNGIPDTGLDQFYYAPNLSTVDPWIDEYGSFDATGFNSPTLDSDGINGYQTVSYNSSNNQHHEGNANSGLGTNGEWTAVIVADLSTTQGGQHALTIGDANSGYNLRLDSGTFTVNHAGSGIIDSEGSYTDAPIVVVATYDGSNVILDSNNTEQINTTLATPKDPVSKTTIAARDDGSGNAEFFADGLIGAAGHEAAAADATRRDELTNTLADAFDITI